jgi:acetylornithine deacetylase/succinyl-diaminopimelate desuccinylase-like protein
MNAGHYATPDARNPLTYARANRSRFTKRLARFVAIPSVSAEPAHQGDVRRAAGWLTRHLASIGMERVAIRSVGGPPVVTASWAHAPGRPTLVIYGHYDVQPVDPLSEWRTPPFEPRVIGENLLGRGACDDKGQMFAQINALESWLKNTGRLAVNVKCLFEGEEEVGCQHLPHFLKRYPDAVAADVAAMSDTRMLGPNRPVLTYGLRGSLALEIDIRGLKHDLHSGNFGGAVRNPIEALCELVTRLHDAEGHVAIPHFYDRVRPDPKSAQLARIGRSPSDAEILRDAGVKEGWGESGYSLYERTTSRPAMTVNGFTGGYQGPGGKAVIPAHASVKLSFRLVPDQDPREIERLVPARLAQLAPIGVKVTVPKHSQAQPALVELGHPAMRAAAAAYRRAFGVAPVALRSGGTIPVVDMLQQHGIPTVLMGFALPDDRIHAPNEKFHLPTFHRGIATCIWFLAGLGAWRPRPGVRQRVRERRTAR